MKWLALLFIRFYQRNISPHKGFVCAYRKYTGHASCSEFGYRAIRRFGLLHGIGTLQYRLKRCANINRQYNTVLNHKLHTQAGFVDGCDCGGGGCDSGCSTPDLSSCDCNLSDIFSSGSDGLDTNISLTDTSFISTSSDSNDSYVNSCANSIGNFFGNLNQRKEKEDE